MTTVPVPSDLEQALSQCAARRRVAVDEIVHEALSWYLQISDDLWDELTAWQEVRDEAFDLVKEPPPS